MISYSSQLLKEHSLKATEARIAVLEALKESAVPLDATTLSEVLEKRNIKADPATIFRIVNVLKEKGITKEIHFNEGKMRYELSNLPEHHHAICTQCGSIEDVSYCSINKLENEIQKNSGFKVKQHSLEFFGVCKNCL